MDRKRRAAARGAAVLDVPFRRVFRPYSAGAHESHGPPGSAHGPLRGHTQEGQNRLKRNAFAEICTSLQKRLWGFLQKTVPFVKNSKAFSSGRIWKTLSFLQTHNHTKFDLMCENVYLSAKKTLGLFTKNCTYLQTTQPYHLIVLYQK